MSVRRMLIILVLAVIPGAIGSCCKDWCVQYWVLLNFEEFTDREMDSVIYRKFQPSGTFTQKIDTTLEIMGWTSGRTSFTFYTESIDPAYDYEVSPAGTNRTFRISAMTTYFQKCRCASNDIKRVSSCKVDGITTAGDSIVLYK